jgi:hypothetical protein
MKPRWLNQGEGRQVMGAKERISCHRKEILLTSTQYTYTWLHLILIKKSYTWGEVGERKADSGDEFGNWGEGGNVEEEA